MWEPFLFIPHLCQWRWHGISFHHTLKPPLVRTCYGSSEGVAVKRSDAVGGIVYVKLPICRLSKMIAETIPQSRLRRASPLCTRGAFLFVLRGSFIILFLTFQLL